MIFPKSQKLAFTLLFALLGPMRCFAGDAAEVAPKAGTVSFEIAGVLAKLPYKGLEESAKSGRAIRFYTSDDSELARPLVVIFPGSGCDGAFKRDESGRVYGSLEAFVKSYLADVRVVVLEPYGIPRQYASPEPGTAVGCPAEFIKHDNFADTVAYYRDVMDAVRRRHWLKSGKIMFVGMSEGVVYAAEMAGAMPEVSNLTLISGFGSDQLFGFVHQALGAGGDDDGKPLQKTRELVDRWQAIMKEPGSIEKFYAGHPYSRWSTVAAQSPVDKVLQGKADLFLVQGGIDDSTPAIGFEYAISRLVWAKRRFTMKYVDCGNHELVCDKDHGAPVNLARTMQQGLDWFLGKNIEGDGIVSISGN